MKGLIFFFLFGSSLLSGQSFHFRQLPPFPDPEVSNTRVIFQASDHLVWMGTDRGLYSFDGRRYAFIPRPDNQPGAVTAISESPDGMLWTGYSDGYLQICRPYQTNEEIAADSLRGIPITSILFHASGRILITTYGKGIWQFGEKLTRVNEPTLAKLSDIYDAVIDHEEAVWLATDDGAWRFNPALEDPVMQLSRRQGLPDDIVTMLCSAADESIWLGLYDHGLVRYSLSPENLVIEKRLSSDLETVTGMAAGPRNQTWLATDKELYLCTPHQGCRTITLPPDLPERMETIFVDRQGHLWLSSGKSLFFANTDLESLDTGIEGIQSVAVTNTTLWIGSDHGLYGMDKVSGKVRPYLQDQKMNILSLYSDTEGTLWIGTFGQGLYIFHPSTQQLRRLTEEQQISNNSILNIDGLGKMVWLATLGGITEINWAEDLFLDPLSIRRFQDVFDFPAGYVYDVCAGMDGRVWFGTDGQGLYFLEGSVLQKFEPHTDSVRLGEDDLRTVYSVAPIDSSSVWVSSAMGTVFQFDHQGQVKQKWETTRGLPGSLQVSGEGDVLMVTDEMVRIHETDGSYLVLNEANGLSGFTPHLNATTKDADGRVWIAGTNKIFRYASSSPEALNQVRMYLESNILLQGDINSVVRLKPDSNFLDVHFTGLWYDDPARVQYRYRLEGHDPDWIYTREGRAVYSRLAPGHYTFHVEGTHQENFLKAGTLQFKVEVLPPVYQRWWFVTVLLLTTTGGIIWFIRARIRRINNLHQLEREKTMLQLHAIQAQVNPHFLFNSFNTLSSIIEEDQDAAVDYVDQLAGFFRGVLMHRQAELIRLEEEMEIVRHYAYILQKRYGDNLRIQENIEHLSGMVAPLSIQLLVENAIKHNTVSGEKPLTVHITISGDWVSVSNRVQPKFQASSESTGFGLSSLLTRYQYLTSRRIEIGEDQNIFTVKIPIIHTETKS